MTRHTKRLSFVLVCSAVCFVGACGDDDDDHSAASSAGAAGVAAGGSETTGGSHTGGTKATGGHATGGQSEAGSAADAGSTSEGGAAGAGPARAGNAGQDQGGTGPQPQGGSAGQQTAPSAGQGGQGGAPMSVPEACATQCQAQEDLTLGAAGAGVSCYDPDCKLICTDPVAEQSEWATPCPDEYIAMVQCEALLTPDEWYCSDLGFDDIYVPAPIAGTDCEEQICAWTCCDQSEITLPDLYDRCHCGV
jgi:hypothetical protein